VSSATSSHNRQSLNTMPHSNVFRIMVFTDNHCGYLETDPIRGEDSFLAFEEALRFARENDCDMAVNTGDIFHENKPSRYSFQRVITALRTFCMGPRPIRFDLLGEQSRHFGLGNKFKRANYLDPHFNIDLPIFCAHGNHDDPTIHRGHEVSVLGRGSCRPVAHGSHARSLSAHSTC
jgi:double-strand break repair protein MRE11